MAKGSVKRRGKVWSFVVDLGPDPATGAHRRAYRCLGVGTLSEAIERCRALGIDLEGDREVDGAPDSSGGHEMLTGTLALG